MDPHGDVVVLREGGIQFLAELFDRLLQLAGQHEFVSPLFCDQIVVGFRFVSLEDHLPFCEAVRNTSVGMRLPEVQQDKFIFLYRDLFAFVADFHLAVQHADH